MGSVTATETVPIPLQVAVMQDRVWVRGQDLEEMDRHHRANLIPFLRRNSIPLYAVIHDVSVGDVDPVPAEEWLEQTPLMRRLVALEVGRSIEDRKATHERNNAYEAATGYQKIQLAVREPILLDDDEWWWDQ